MQRALNLVVLIALTAVTTGALPASAASSGVRPDHVPRRPDRQNPGNRGHGRIQAVDAAAHDLVIRGQRYHVQAGAGVETNPGQHTLGFGALQRGTPIQFTLSGAMQGKIPVIDHITIILQ